MKTNPKRKAASGVNLGFQIAPMIDVVFVVMLFFMVMAGAVQVENTQPARLPGRIPLDPNVRMPLLDEIAIRIDDDGQVLLNDDPLDTPASRSLPALANTLKLLRESSDATNSEVLVTIHANELARYQRIADVLDALSRARISNVTFQVAAPE